MVTDDFQLNSNISKTTSNKQSQTESLILDENNCQQQQIETQQNFDWPDSFIELLNSLSQKQQQQQQHLIDINDTCNGTSLPSPGSSILADNRDFELVALDFDQNDHDMDDSDWLINFPNNYSNTNSNDHAQIISLATSPIASTNDDLLPLAINNRNPFLMDPSTNCDKNEPECDLNNNNVTLLDDIVVKTNNENINHDKNLVNLMKILSNKSTSNENLNEISPMPSPKHEHLCNFSTTPISYLTRCKTLPIRFNRITSFNFSEQQSVNDQLSKSETKQDFEEDEESKSTDSNNGIESEKIPDTPLNEQQQQQQQQVAPSQNGSLRSRKSERVAQDADGRHSMLQFALYNFREAISKYSLESRAHKAQVGAGDTSTLRGSLKLIESLRSSRSSRNGPEQQLGNSQQQQQQIPTRDKQVQPDEWTWRELAEMVKFTPTMLKHSLLKLSSEELERKALESFRAIMQYMGDAPDLKQPAQTQEVECVYLILMNCHNFPQLRDEIYCQLLKQTTNNRSVNPESCLRGWRLFSIVAAYFDCSSHFKPYLLKYLETAAYDKRRAYCSVALLCLQNLRKTFKYGGRRNVPSIEEIAATSAGRNSKRQIYRLPGGTERVINTKSTTVVDDIIHEICSNMLGVTNSDEMLEFSLYCIADGDLYTMPLNRDEYILDITTELIKNHQQYFLIFCRSIWHYPLRLDSKLYIEVIFNQIAPDYLEGLLLVLPGTLSSTNHQQQHHRAYPPQSSKTAHPLRLKTKTVKEIARIAALLHRASGTDYMPHKDEVKYLLPKPVVAALKHYQRSATTNSEASSSGSSSGSSLARAHPHSSAAMTTSSDTFLSASQQQLREDESDQLTSANNQHETLLITTPQKWVELVQNNWREMSAFDTLDAKAQFLDIVRHWPLFGSSFFAIKFIQRDLIQPMNFILALNKLGIQMLDMNTHETIHKYPFNDVISTRKVRSEDGALFLDLKCGNLMKRTIIRIQTDQAHEISRLIRQYIDIELLQQKQQQQQLLQPPCTNQTAADNSGSSQILPNNESPADEKAN